MIICYMASPIDYMKNKELSWKEELLSLCKMDDNLAFFDPYVPFKFRNIDNDIATYIHDINMTALDHADILIGLLNKDQISVGTPIEFYIAYNNNKPMIIITDMVKSIYMQYIGKHAIFVNDVCALYNELIKMTKK